MFHNFRKVKTLNWMSSSVRYLSFKKHLSSFQVDRMLLNICGYSVANYRNYHIQLMFFPRTYPSSQTNSCSSLEFKLRVTSSQKSFPVSLLVTSPTRTFHHSSESGVFLLCSFITQNIVMYIPHCIYHTVLQWSADFSQPPPNLSSHSQATRL